MYEPNTVRNAATFDNLDILQKWEQSSNCSATGCPETSTSTVRTHEERHHLGECPSKSGYAYRKPERRHNCNQGVEVSWEGLRYAHGMLNGLFPETSRRTGTSLVRLAPDQTDYTIYWTRFYDAWYLKAIEGKPIGVI